ncbi:hypothetical protein LAUMK41_05785 [Mycobacterium attenuatum]|nr:hypothetical protein LAUMK41_05785 [Mycobacterium attenuatum]
MPVRASNQSRPSRAIPASSDADGAHIHLACSRGPVSVSTVTALTSTVCISGIGKPALLLPEPNSQMRQPFSAAWVDEPTRPR